MLFSSSNHISVCKKYLNVLQDFRESVRFSSTSWVRTRSCVFTCGSIGANFGQKFAHFAFKLLNFISNIDACCFLLFLLYFIILFLVGKCWVSLRIYDFSFTFGDPAFVLYVIGILNVFLIFCLLFIFFIRLSKRLKITFILMIQTIYVNTIFRYETMNIFLNAK